MILLQAVYDLGFLVIHQRVALLIVAYDHRFGRDLVHLYLTGLHALLF